MARNPEIKWRLKPEDFAPFHERQGKILASALRCLNPRGRLVYATCSLEPEENETVIQGYGVQRTHLRLPGREEGDGFFAAVIAAHGQSVTL